MGQCAVRWPGEMLVISHLDSGGIERGATASHPVGDEIRILATGLSVREAAVPAPTQRWANVCDVGPALSQRMAALVLASTTRWGPPPVPLTGLAALKLIPHHHGRSTLKNIDTLPTESLTSIPDLDLFTDGFVFGQIHSCYPVPFIPETRGKSRAGLCPRSRSPYTSLTLSWSPVFIGICFAFRVCHIHPTLLFL